MPRYCGIFIIENRSRFAVFEIATIRVLLALHIAVTRKNANTKTKSVTVIARVSFLGQSEASISANARCNLQCGRSVRQSHRKLWRGIRAHRPNSDVIKALSGRQKGQREYHIISRYVSEAGSHCRWSSNRFTHFDYVSTPEIRRARIE